MSQTASLNLHKSFELQIPDFYISLKQSYPVQSPETASTIVDISDDGAFEMLFKQHFKALHSYANAILRDEEQAEEIVQSVFIKLWEKRNLLSFETSVKSYLYRSVHNECLNFLKHAKVKAKYEDHAAYTNDGLVESASQKIELKELDIRIHEALEELPQQCRIIFHLSRFEELKYREIADQMNLSVKTVENQMGKALKLMREKLRDFLPIFLVWILIKLLG